MANKKRKKTVEFLLDYAGQKKGAHFTADPMLCRSLVDRKKAIWVSEKDIDAEKKAQASAKKAKDSKARAAKAAKKRNAKKKTTDKAVRNEKYKNVSEDDLPEDVKKAIADAKKSEKAEKEPEVKE